MVSSTHTSKVKDHQSPDPTSSRVPDRQSLADCALRIFVHYGSERVTLDVLDHERVRDVRERVREAFSLDPDEGPAGTEAQDKKFLTLMYAGGDLENEWLFSSIGIVQGSTVKAILKDLVNPSMYVYCAFNEETVAILDKINVARMTVSEFRSLVSRKTGLPVGSFRLLSRQQPGGMEMYDCQTLEVYGLSLGGAVRLETWDGWGDLLNRAIMGSGSHVLQLVSPSDVTARYQLKVALYVAAHFGHVDLAVTLLRQGIRADEAVGEHPLRQWCKGALQHPDTLKAPVHEAAEAGQLGVLRSLVHHNVCNVLAKDGGGLTPLNIALRKQQKACASFLLTKQWSKVHYTKKVALPLSIFVKMKRWAAKAKDKVLVIQGHWKSSIKNPKRHLPAGALVDHGVQLDGFSRSKLCSRPAAQLRAEEEQAAAERQRRRWRREQPPPAARSPLGDMDAESYFKSLACLQNFRPARLTKFGRLLSKAADQEKRRAQLAVPRLNEADGPNVMDPKGTSLPATDGTLPSPGGANPTLRLPELQLNKSHNLSTDTGRRSLDDWKGSRHSVSVRSVGEGARPKGSEGSSGEKRSWNGKTRGQPVAAKVRTGDGSVALPARSLENTPRPFLRAQSEGLTLDTLALFHKYRGVASRDYAIRCLEVANSFKEKPWLQQVQQAMLIARHGVKHLSPRKPRTFLSDPALDAVTPTNHRASSEATNQSTASISAGGL